MATIDISRAHALPKDQARTKAEEFAKSMQERKSGDVIWHAQGEDAPRLVNQGERAYRTVVIELK